MKPKWILVMIGVSLLIGGVAGAVTTDFAAWVGASVFSFAFIFAITFYFSNKLKRGSGEDIEGESIEPESEVQFQGAIIDERDPEVRDRMIQAFIDEFHINRDKAENLFDAGYARWSDFSEAIPEDLLMVEGINPTVARRIISTVRSK